MNIFVCFGFSDSMFAVVMSPEKNLWSSGLVGKKICRLILERFDWRNNNCKKN